MKIKNFISLYILIMVFSLVGCEKDKNNLTEDSLTQKDETEIFENSVINNKSEFALMELASCYDGKYKIIITEDMMKWLESGNSYIPDANERRWDILERNEAEKQALGIKPNEDVYKVEIYDFPICDYIEKIYGTVNDSKEIGYYSAVYDRGGKLKAVYEGGIIDNYSEDAFVEFIHYIYLGFNENMVGEPGVRICKNKQEMKEKEIYGKVYLEDQNIIINREGIYQEEPPSDDYIIKQDTGRLYDSESDITVSLNCYYIELVNFPYAEKINKRIREYTEEQQHSLLEDAKIKFAPKAESQEDDEDVYYMDYRSGLYYQDTSYIAIKGSGYCHLIGTSLMDAESNSWFLYFNLKTGEEVKAEDFLGKGCGFEELKNAAWTGYQKLMGEEPDKYTKRAFDDYYEKVPEDKITYYFSEEGMVFYYRYYDNEDSESWEDLPVEYRLNENLAEDYRMNLIVSYEDLEQIGKE